MSADRMSPAGAVLGVVASSVPLPGPIEVDPSGEVAAMALAWSDPAKPHPAGALVRAMLDQALTGVPLGAYDQRIIRWLAGWDTPTIATIASLLRRSWQAGLDDGRAELQDRAEELAARLVDRDTDLAGVARELAREHDRNGEQAEQIERLDAMAGERNADVAALRERLAERERDLGELGQAYAALEETRLGLARHVLECAALGQRLQEIAVDADAALEEETRDRQVIAEDLLGSVQVAARVLTGYGNDEDQEDAQGDGQAGGEASERGAVTAPLAVAAGLSIAAGLFLLAGGWVPAAMAAAGAVVLASSGSPRRTRGGVR